MATATAMKMVTAMTSAPVLRIEKSKKIWGLRASALVEIVVFFIVALLIDRLALNGDRFWGLEPHPFWIIVLPIAAHYGTSEGLLAAAAATFFLLFGNLPPKGVGQDMYDYLFMVAKNPILWMAMAVALGEIRLRHVRERDRMRDDLRDARGREEKIAESYEWVKELKERMELRIAGQLRSSIAIYQAAKAMETLSPTELLGGIESMVRAVMGPDQFSIFLLEKEGLNASVTHGWKENDGYPRRYDSRSELYRAIVGGKQTICAANPVQEQLLAGHGVLAAPLVDKATGEISGMIKVERLGFTDLNLSTIEAFTALGEWAGMSLANAGKYQLAKSASMINPDHNLMTFNYFRRFTDYMIALGKRVGFDVTMIVVRLANPDALDPLARTQVARILSEVTNSVLRDVDLAFDYQALNEEYSVVLPATSREGAETVLGKIRQDLQQRTGRIVRQAEFSFTVQPLYAK